MLKLNFFLFCPLCLFSNILANTFELTSLRTLKQRNGLHYVELLRTKLLHQNFKFQLKIISQKTHLNGSNSANSS